MIMIRLLRNVFISIKVYIQRMNSYLSILNAGMILFLFLSKINEVGIIDVNKKRIIPAFNIER